MPKLHHVQKARKANKQAGIKKGQEYWWAAYRSGARGSYKRYWKSRPRSSQVVSSEYMSSVFAIQEAMEDFSGTKEDLESARDGWVGEIEEIGYDCQDKFDNMPEGLQQGGTGQLLEERNSNMEAWANDVGSIEVDEQEVAEAIQQMLDACPE